MFYYRMEITSSAWRSFSSLLASSEQFPSVKNPEDHLLYYTYVDILKIYRNIFIDTKIVLVVPLRKEATYKYKHAECVRA